MISVKDFAVMSWNGIWPFVSDTFVTLVILQQLSSVESHVDFWVKIGVMFAGSFFGWKYIISKTNRENAEVIRQQAETRREQAEARRVEIDNEERILQNEIERKHYESVIRKMATEELIGQLAENVKNIDDDRGISDQLKKHGIRIDKFEKHG
jgi:hypothetical protein